MLIAVGPKIRAVAKISSDGRSARSNTVSQNAIARPLNRMIHGHALSIHDFRFGATHKLIPSRAARTFRSRNHHAGGITRGESFGRNAGSRL